MTGEHVSYRRFVIGLAATAAAALAAAPVAGAVDYPPPVNPKGASGKPKGPSRTLRVCKKGHKCFPRIQDAVNEARAGDTIRVANGTYREGVVIKGNAKRYIKLIGNPAHPEKVLLQAKRQKKANGVLINGADHVTVNGFTARNYKANGFFVTNSNGYTFTNLRAFLVGVYGMYAFNTTGGVMSNSVAAWNNDSGFYIGETPPQAKPKRSIVRNVESYGNVLGFSGTNMRYVTITKSKWYNNGLGIVPNALDSEKYAPPEFNIITDNDIYWNNFNYYAGAPFKIAATATGTPYPIGIGVLLFGGRHNQVTNNRVFGNYLVGVGAIKQVLLKQADAADLIGNTVTGNEFGLGGQDINGRDLFYDGSGSDNCWGPNSGVQKTTPENGSTLAACPFSGTNAFSADAQNEALNWAVGDPTHEAFWIKHPHAARAGETPLEHYAGEAGK
jgi:hypothetical protein